MLGGEAGGGGGDEGMNPNPIINKIAVRSRVLCNNEGDLAVTDVLLISIVPNGLC